MWLIGLLVYMIGVTIMGKKNKMKVSHILLREKKTLCGVKPNTKMSLVKSYREATCMTCKYILFTNMIEKWFNDWLQEHNLTVLVEDRSFNIYRESLDKREQYINKWSIHYNKGGTFNKLTTFKRVSEISKTHLYNEDINPISIRTTMYEDKVLFKIMVESSDDSSYGMWREDISEDMFHNILTWVYLHKEIDGEEMFIYGKKLGFGNFDYD